MGNVITFASDQDVSALTRRVLQLFRLALPNPADRGLFERCMHEARTKGLSWIEGLEYAAECRVRLCA